jgi:cholesterol oxidase
MAMQSRYDALVIGTGFGGSVASCRLSQAGLRVAIVERGRRYPLGSFPRNWSDPLDGWLWSERQGLFDVRPFEQMTVVQGAGYGGGSLIYANVHLRATPSVFESRWPAIYSRAMLDPYYDLVAYMLDISPINAPGRRVPAKATIVQQAAAKLGRADQFCFPNIAVDFGDPNNAHENRFGVEQRGCQYCGECDIGCNYHAKNTLDLNYLSIAENHGAEVFVQCEAIKIALATNGYKVSMIDHASGGRAVETEATDVFVCAGAVNSTELLLRCRDDFKTLPNLSDWLGREYSGNGDFLAFAFNTQTPFKPSDGPTITSGIVFDAAENGTHIWFILEEGGYPKEIGGLLQVLNRAGGFPLKEAVFAFDELRGELRVAARGKIGAVHPASDSTAVFLAMGRDNATGLIDLHPISRSARIKWDTASNLPLYSAESRLVADVAKAMGGVPAENPFWRILHVPVSVHNLGGCVMGNDRNGGVTDPDGQVFGYEGLYVLDGAILPAATGVNPSHTIAAVAERNIEAAIRKIKRDANWSAPERAMAKAVTDPVSKITVPAGGTALPQTPAIGIEFTETMKGFGVKGFQPADDYFAAETAGKKASAEINFTLTISTDNLDAFLADPNRTAVAKGVVRADPFTGPDGAPVTNGIFNLFVQGAEFYQRKMLYALPFIGGDDRPYLLHGFKDVKDDGRLDVWSATSTLYTVIREGHARDGAIVATGILHILIQDFMRQLTTFHATGTNSPIEKSQALARFGKSFFGTLWDVFITPHLQSR